MDEKTLAILEFPKILERLAAYCAFSASQERARLLRPTADPVEARRRQSIVTEACRLLLTHADLSIGGARDVRGPVDLARHGGVLAANELLDVRSTLAAARSLARTFERLGYQYPGLSEIAGRLPPPLGLIDAITRAISDRGEILDSASDKLAEVRRELRIVHDRLLAKLQKMVADPRNGPYLQDPIITQRDGRYVIPLRSEFKGRIRSIVHDQSQSGATLFVEPLGVVEQNNRYRELQLAERDEERRILTELSQQVAARGVEIVGTVDVIAELDLALACAKYSEDLRAAEPTLRTFPPAPIIVGDKTRSLEGASLPPAQDDAPISSQRTSANDVEAPTPTGSPRSSAQSSVPPLNPEPSASPLFNLPPGSVIRLYRARHPLLDPETVVPIDVELDPQTYVLVITGPNTGGKTVALKTVGLLALMAQTGLHLPAQSGSEISVFERIFADIGDEQSIEQSLSTFSGHVTNIIRILEQADRRSLVILDELGAGTDPQEGSALARAILEHLAGRGITTLVTTHHPELKAFAHATPGVTNASVEFDLETLRPTYHLTVGLPGRSNAVAIAERLGLPAEIITAARREIHPDELRADALLDEILAQRESARRARLAADDAHRQSEALRVELLTRLDGIEEERRRLLEAARREAAERLELVEADLEGTRKTLARLRRPLDEIKEAREKLDEIQESVETPVDALPPEPGPLLRKHEAERRRGLRLGDRVRVKRLGAQGVISALGEDEYEVSLGALRIRVRPNEVELPTASGAPAMLAAKTARKPAASPEADPRTQPGAASRPSSAAASRSAEPRLTGETRSAEDRRLASGDDSPAAGARTGGASGLSLPASPGFELDIRGRRADDALIDLDRFLDAAVLAGLPFVRIIHGKGTGRLRDVVRQALHEHPEVRTFQAGEDKEGGEGVTVAKLG